MRILGIETSCDETALSLIEAEGVAPERVTVFVLADKTLSQIELHRQYGGVFPNMAKREHSRNLIPVLETVLAKSGFGNSKSEILNLKQIPNSKFQILNSLLNREPELLKQFTEFIPTIAKPQIDAIAVTEGPGLEPCLWTGINFAKALSLVWDIPVIPVNHMEGHIISALLRPDEKHKAQSTKTKQTTIRRGGQSTKLDATPARLPAAIQSGKHYTLHAIRFPALALLISGGHTELVLMKDWFDYELIGQTRDDAVGEAFDKVARLLGLPYPGGPEISALAEELRSKNYGIEKDRQVQLPRPMIHSADLDFSFSGIKTSVLYLIKKLGTLENATKTAIAREFEDAVTEVLVEKTRKALRRYNAEAILIGGGVIANRNIRRAFEELSQEMEVSLFIPEPNLTTDNALMIAVAGFLRLTLKNGSVKPQKGKIAANGSLALDPVRGRGTLRALATSNGVDEK